MKKIIMLVLCLNICLILNGCNNNNVSDDSENTQKNHVSTENISNNTGTSVETDNSYDVEEVKREKPIMNNKKLSDEIRTLLENAKKWQQLLFDSEYVTTGRIIGRVTWDSGDFSDIKEINFENSAGTQILELLKKTYSSEKLINSHLIRLGFVCIDNRIYKVDSLACEGCKIGRIESVSILEDGPEKKRLYVPEEHVDSTHEESLEEYIENIGYRYLEVIKDKNSNWIISWQETYEFDPAKIQVFK